MARVFSVGKPFALKRFGSLLSRIKSYEPGSLGLPSDFSLYLKDIGDGSIAKETPDCSVTKFRHDPSKHLISTTDFFYPLIEDPYMQGRISCCNVLSDIYAMGIPNVDHMLMVLGVSLQMREQEREVITREMIRGFNDCAEEAETQITGGQSIMNKWPIIGGVANIMCRDDEYIKPNFGEPGDIIILTKPLGTQPIVNVHQWLVENDEDKLENVYKFMNQEQIKHTYYLAIESMAHLNRNSARLMKKYQSHGATDITGFGILGHAQNLAAAQRNPVDIVIHSLPILNQMDTIDQKVQSFNLLSGYSAETSGGLFIMLPQNKVKEFMNESLNEYGQQTWIVGEVTKGQKQAQIRKDLDIIQIKDSFLIK